MGPENQEAAARRKSRTTRNRRTSRLPFDKDQMQTLAALRPSDTLSWSRSDREGYAEEEEDTALPLRATVTVVERDTSPSAVAAMESLPPVRFDATPADFVLIRKIAQGGQGEVWEAWQSSLMRRVAVKRQTSGSIRDFLQEAYTTGELDHPNIIPIYELGRTEVDGTERPLLAMKMVNGRPWDREIEEDRKKKDFNFDLHLSRHLRVLLDVCHAVEFAHSKHVIHRDLKPQQVMIGDFGEVLLMDWGLAMSVKDPGDTQAGVNLPKFRTRDKAMNRCGTPVYMAPEQTAEDTNELGFATDVYLLGAILFEIVANVPPHEAETAEEAFELAMTNEVLPLPQDCPEALRAIIDKALNGNPTARQKSVREFREAVEDYLTGASRQRESREIARDISRKLAISGVHDYDEFAQIEQNLARATSLWPNNPAALSLQEEVRAAHTRLALKHGDLSLAKTLVRGLYYKKNKEPLEQRIHEEEDAIQRQHRQRRRLKMAMMTALGIIFIGMMGVAVREKLNAHREAQLREAAEVAEEQAIEQKKIAQDSLTLAEEERRLAQENLARAEEEQYFASIGFADSAIRDGRYDVARMTLFDAPAHLRQWEWGRLIWRSHPDLITLSGHGDRLLNAEFSMDGARILTAAADRTTHVWDAITGRELLVLLRRDAFLEGATLSPDGEMILANYQDNTTKIWETRTGELLATITGMFDCRLKGQFSPNGDRLVLTSFGEAKVWSVSLKREIMTLQGHINVVNSAMFNADGTRILTASRDNTAKVWDSETAKLLYTVPERSALMQLASFSPDGRYIVTTYQDNSAAIWKTTTGQPVSRLVGHSDWITGVSFSPDCTQIVTASRDRTARVWDVISGQLQQTLIGHSDALRDVCFNNAGDRILTASADRTARMWDAENGSEIAVMRGHLGPLVTVSVSADDERILTSSEDGSARVWNVSAIRGRQVVERSARMVEKAVTSPDGKFMVKFSPHYRPEGAEEPAIVMDLDKGIEIARLEGHLHGILSAAFSPDSRRIVTGSWDSTAKIWDTKTGNVIVTLAGHSSEGVRSARFSNDGTRVVTASNDRTAKIWDSITGKLLVSLEGHTSWVTSAAFSNDDKRIVTASGDHMARVWDATTGEELALLTGHSDEVLSASFSPDDHRVVTASSDGTVKIWDPDSGREILTLGETNGTILRARFSENGTQIIASVEEDQDIIWDTISWKRSDDQIGPPCMTVADRVEYWKRLERLKARVEPADVRWFYEVVPGDAQPMSSWEKTKIEEGTPLHFIVRMGRKDDGHFVFIAGSTHSLGDWTPNTTALKYKGRVGGGHLWVFDTKFEEMEFKFTYGRPGADWPGTEEWTGGPNRVLPDPAVTAFKGKKGDIYVVYDFGTRN
ncbi:protein kinase [bacterium]|nr:protein kinase [bacterium]